MLRAYAYQGLDLELLDPGTEEELTFLLEAQHLELEEALERHDEVTVRGQPMNPRLHVTLHVLVANQLLADDPPETWQTVQRLAGLGYDWHNIMHDLGCGRRGRALGHDRAAAVRS